VFYQAGQRWIAKFDRLRARLVQSAGARVVFLLLFDQDVQPSCQDPVVGDETFGEPEKLLAAEPPEVARLRVDRYLVEPQEVRLQVERVVGQPGELRRALG
jgi:hypothetical protein